MFAPSYHETAPTEYIAIREGEYDLEGAKAEIGRISKYVPSELFVEEAATKSQFKMRSPEFDILHLSLHSVLNKDIPELSTMVFADHEGDHILHLSELYGYNLNAKLAVLSACNTGIGAAATGNEIVSMTRAFNDAGVPSIISSLWSVPDLATKNIMPDVYLNLKDGKSKSEALRLAKLAFLQVKYVAILQRQVNVKHNKLTR